MLKRVHELNTLLQLSGDVIHRHPTRVFPTIPLGNFHPLTSPAPPDFTF